MGETPSRYSDYSDDQLKQEGFSNDVDYNDTMELEKEKRRREKKREQERQAKKEFDDALDEQELARQRALEQLDRNPTSSDHEKPSSIQLSEQRQPSPASNRPSTVRAPPRVAADISSTKQVSDQPAAKSAVHWLHIYCLVLLLVLDYCFNVYLGVSFLFGITYGNDCDANSLEPAWNSFFYHSIFTFVMSTIGFACGAFSLFFITNANDGIYDEGIGMIVLLKIAFQDIACGSIVFNAFLYRNYRDIVCITSLSLAVLNIFWWLLVSCRSKAATHMHVCKCCCFVPLAALCGIIVMESFVFVNAEYSTFTLYSWTVDGECVGVFDTAYDWSDLNWNDGVCETIDAITYCVRNSGTAAWSEKDGDTCYRTEYTIDSNANSTVASCAHFPWIQNWYRSGSHNCGTWIPKQLCIDPVQTRFPFIPVSDARGDSFNLIMIAAGTVAVSCIVCCSLFFSCRGYRARANDIAGGSNDMEPEAKSWNVYV